MHTVAILTRFTATTPGNIAEIHERIYTKVIPDSLCVDALRVGSQLYADRTQSPNGLNDEGALTWEKRTLWTNRGERIRTSGLLRPRQARYQAALRPDKQEVHCASFDSPLQ